MKSAFDKIARGMADAIAFADSARNHSGWAFPDNHLAVGCTCQIGADRHNAYDTPSSGSSTIAALPDQNAAR